ncbi:MAG TPA: cation-translocating P-type ATPase [Quisquiliibacterium sp.]|nr:cation-translocating P-type ATPase [Quisquiliibacterium sp.]
MDEHRALQDVIAPGGPGTVDAHLREAHAVADALEVDPDHGLDAAQAAARMARHGPNELVERAARGPWGLLLDQFRDFMILVLIAAAVISGLIGDLVDTLAILVIVVLNALIGFVQAWRADRAMAALRRLAAAHATVLRDGHVQVLPAGALVPGDIVLLEAGNQVPADLRLLEVAQLRVDESALTGESVTVRKEVAVLQAGASALGDRINLAFKGTSVAHGRGRGVVIATGMATELGRVAGLLDEGGERSTPLQQRLAAFGRRLALVVIAICAVIFAVGVLRGEAPLLMILTAVSLAVAAIPEALPAVVTVLLALGAREMVRLNALIRRLPSVETLGSVSTICSDKTGTLTQNRMQVDALVVPGACWAPGPQAPGAAFVELLRAAGLCNDASRGTDGTWQGDPTETALAQAAWDAGAIGTPAAASGGDGERPAPEDRPRVHEFPFDSERKRMTTVHAHGGGFVAYTKGAPESVIGRCVANWPSEDACALGALDGGGAPDGGGAFDAAAWLQTAEAMAARGLRVLALARRAHPHGCPASQADTVESEMQFIGLVGLIDPPRPEAAEAVADCLTAGITPVMITGDHPATARAIALRLGIVGAGDAPVLTGVELAALDDATLRERVTTVRVYARVDPAQKIRIVEALQGRGRFVAMTGDGVNDAPALKRADIGVAMGRNGTDVAREASSLVLLDDNFATIVAAVREGRRIFDNIRKFVRYAMTGNSGEIWTIFLAPLVGLPIPLLPIHILWVNLVTDGLPGLALAAEPAERGIMQRPPRPPDESLFANGMWQHILGIGLLIGGLCLGVQAWALSHGNAHAQSMVFTVLTLSQMAHVLAIRSEHRSLLRIGLMSNRPLLGAVLLTFGLQLATLYVPVLNPVFQTQPLSALELAVCCAAALVVFVTVELEKSWRRRRARSASDKAPDAPG